MVEALYFDGRSARQYAVALSAESGKIAVRGGGIERVEPLSVMRISSKVGHSPRHIYFSDGAHCEIGDHAGLEALLREAGLKPLSLLARMEANWRHVLAALVLFAVFLFATYQWGLPWAANAAARKVPQKLVQTIDTQFLESMEGDMLLPTKLSRARQRAISRRFDSLRVSGGLPSHNLLFRNSPAIGANAFALPGGSIVVTDQLVKLAANDDEVLAVLAHELGHVAERHPMRQLLQSSVVGLAMTWYFGDISSLLAAAPTLLLETSYSRDFERRADRFAVDTLRANGIAPTRLADMLEKLEAAHGGGVKKEDRESSGFSRYLTTHPETSERIRDIRSEAAR